MHFSIRRAFVGRDPDGKCFGGHIDGEQTPRETADGFSNVEDALRWARERAQQVQVTFGWRDGDVFSAGGLPIEDLPAWPPSDDERRAIEAHIEAVVSRRAETPSKIGVVCPEVRET